MNDAKIINNIENSEEEFKDISGHLYCLFNMMFKLYGGDDYYKLGKAFDVPKRLASYSTYYPELSEMLEESAMLRNKHLAERVLFTKLAQYRDKKRREFFKCNRILIKQTFNEIEEIFAKYTDEQIVKIYDIKIKPNKKKPIIKNNNCENENDDDTVEEYDIVEDDGKVDNIVEDDNDGYIKDVEDGDKIDDIEDGDENIYEDVIETNNTSNIIVYGDANINVFNEKTKKYCCEKCDAAFEKKYNYEQHLKRKTPCIPEEKEEYDFDKRRCRHCPKILSSVYCAKIHMKTCKYKHDKPDKIEELTKIVNELTNKINDMSKNNVEKKPKKKN
jgi:hypothetical protein